MCTRGVSCLRLTVGETVFDTHVLRDCGSICNFMIIISFRYFVIIPFAFVMVILIIILQ